VGPQAIAIDATGSIWLANTGANNVIRMSSAGLITQTLTTGIAAPNALALDGTGNLWVSNFTGNSVAAFSTAGTPLAGSPFTNASLAAPTGVAVDTSNNVWVSSSLNGTLAKLNSAGTVAATYTDGLLVAPGGVATDTAHNRVWTAGTGINAVVGLTTAGTAVASEPFAPGVTMPLSVAVDGSGTIWTVNDVPAGSLAGFSYTGSAVTPSTGLGYLNQPTNLAIDSSGNLWATSSGDNSVTQFVGLATPVTTPLVSGVR
jgi:sugar lactone lactonase YvrE